MEKSTVTSDRIRTLRREAGLSQQQVAEALGIDRSAYTYFENGDTDIKLKRLIRIARIFNVGVDELLSQDCLSPNLSARQNPLEGRMEISGNDEKSLLAMYRQLTAEQQCELLKSVKESCKEI